MTPTDAIPDPVNPNPPVNANFDVAIPDLQLPKSWQFNVALEQSLGANQKVTMTYVGAVGRDLIHRFSYYGANPDFPSFTSITTNEGNSDYHAMQLQYHSA